MADDIRRWSDELARDPSSLVFLQLGEALRRQRSARRRAQDRAARTRAASDERRRARSGGAHRRRPPRFRARVRRVGSGAAPRPDHLGAMKGLGLRVLPAGPVRRRRAISQPGGGAGRRRSDVTSALETVRRSSGRRRRRRPLRRRHPATPQWLFADLLVDDGQTALLLDENGYVLGGLYVDDEGNDLAQEIGAQLSGISDEVVRSTRHLDIGDWRSIVFETQVAVVAMAPAPDAGAARRGRVARRRRSACCGDCSTGARSVGGVAGGRRTAWRARERAGNADMSAHFGTLLESLTRQRGVRASLIVSENDGLVVDSSLRFGQDGDRVAALAASLYRKARLSARGGAAWGPWRFSSSTPNAGRICAVGGRGDLVIVVVADPAANVGLIRVELLKALESLA